MRAVKGEVTSSNPVSLAKAAGILSRFASSETGAKPDVAACLRRAAAAFNELVAVHQDIRARRKTSLAYVRCYEDGKMEAETNRVVDLKKEEIEVKAKTQENKVKNSDDAMNDIEADDEGQSSYLKEKKRWKNHLQESLNGDRKKRKHLEVDQEKADGQMRHQEWKKKKKRRTVDFNTEESNFSR